MRDVTIARNYAELLIDLARKGGDPDGWGRMLADVADAMGRDAKLRQFLESPRIGVAQKNDVLAKAFQDRMPRFLVRFLQTLVANRRQMLIPEIATEYQTLVDEVSGRVHAQVTVVRDPSDAERDAITRELTRVLGRQVVPHLVVNPDILGGVVVKVGDTVMDGSVRRRLALLEHQLTGTR